MNFISLEEWCERNRMPLKVGLRILQRQKIAKRVYISGLTLVDVNTMDAAFYAELARREQGIKNRLDGQADYWKGVIKKDAAAEDEGEGGTKKDNKKPPGDGGESS